MYKSGNTGCHRGAVRGKLYYISTGQRATFGLTPSLSRQRPPTNRIFLLMGCRGANREGELN
jgi:hypothetical protein